jgi:hypothetical protein
MLREIRSLGPKNGVVISSIYKGGASADMLADGYSAQRGYRFDADIESIDLVYPGSEVLTASESGGTVTLTWENPGDRFDFVKMILVRKSGSSAPTSVTDGTEIYDGALETFADTPGAGTWSYSIFAAYDFDDDGTADSYSDPRSQTGVVV